jgi:hypothetical protein
MEPSGRNKCLTPWFFYYRERLNPTSAIIVQPVPSNKHHAVRHIRYCDVNTYTVDSPLAAVEDNHGAVGGSASGDCIQTLASLFPCCYLF